MDGNQTAAGEARWKYGALTAGVVMLIASAIAMFHSDEAARPAPGDFGSAPCVTAAPFGHPQVNCAR